MGRGRGEAIDRSRWPPSGPHRAWLEFCDRLHQDNGRASRRALAAAMGLTSATRVNERLRGRGWPADDDQARALLDALGAVGSEVGQGMRLFGAAQRDRPAQVRSSPDSAWWRHSGYIDQVRDIAPLDLLGRGAECDELAEWCWGDETYVWWQAPPSAGKSALMAWFVLHPPPGMQADTEKSLLTDR